VDRSPTEVLATVPNIKLRIGDPFFSSQVVSGVSRNEKAVLIVSPEYAWG
jgi:hypothetical protein